MPERSPRTRASSSSAIALAWLSVCLGIPAVAQAQDSPEWRYWLAADGLQESYTRVIGTSPSGGVAVRHGLIPKMDVLDGYEVFSLPEPRLGLDVDWATVVPAYHLSSREAWAVEGGVLKRLSQGRWVAWATPGPGLRPIDAVPRDARHVVVLFSDLVAELDAERDAWTVVLRAGEAGLGGFRRLVRGSGGGFWIAADRGVGRLEDDRERRWTPYAVPAFSGFASLLPGRDGELFAAAVRTGTREKALFRFAGGRHEIVCTSRKGLRGWRGSDNVLWVLEGATLWRISGTKKELVRKRGPLSGVVYDVATEPGGRFWIASSTGLARHTPPMWRTPEAVRHIEQPVHGVAEDARGRLWFAATEYLLELDGTTWRVHPLPDDARTQTFQTSSIAALADGRVAFMVLEGPSVGRLMAFDPKTRAMRIVAHPTGQPINAIWRRNAESAWVRLENPCRVEVWDGRTFQPRPDVNLAPLCGRVRYVHESSAGDLWIGTTSLAGGVLRRGSPELQALGRNEGYPEPALYTLFEHAPGRMLGGGRDALAEFDGTRWTVIRTGMDTVRSMMRSRDGVLWVASGSGVHRLTNGAWITNGEPEGLPSSMAYRVYEDRLGRIWAGTSRGVSRFDPQVDLDPPRTEVPDGGASEVAPDGNVTIAFTGSDRWKSTPADRLLFSYRVDGGAWSEFRTGQTATFRNLARGAHRFELRAMDRNGNLGAPVEFAVRVAFPWYQQAGFVISAGAGASVIALLVGFAGFQYRQLARAKAVAEAASRCKSEFLANMSHEIRTPMNAIMGMADLASELAASEEQRGYLDTVKTSSTSLLALLNDILDLSKVESGKLQLTQEDFDVHQCVLDAVATLKVAAAAKDVGLHCAIDDDVPRFVCGDDMRLRQILLNLLGNAIKFTASGEVTVRMGLGPSRAPGVVRLRFTVTDTGIGIPSDRQDAIFAPFEQADASMARRFGGTGLGLAISAQLVRLMRGDIRVESPWTDAATGRARDGAAFHFTVEAAPGREPERRTGPAAAGGTRPLRVLVAEDNPVNQLVARRLLQKLGHSVVVAADGEEAVRLCAEGLPDVVLMDVQMPVMDGFEATRIIRDRACPSSPRPFIIALTAHALQGYRDQCLQAGMDDYLTKPIRLDDLARSLARAVAAEAEPLAPTGSGHVHAGERRAG